LERPFLARGHLCFAADNTTQLAGETKCREAAIRIWYLVDAYKRAFTLRRVPYFLTYATYSAIVVILHQPDTSNPQLLECIRFFWFALLDFQKGCTSGLQKPLKILQNLMTRLGQNIPHGNQKDRRHHAMEDPPQIHPQPDRDLDNTYAVRNTFEDDQLFGMLGIGGFPILDDLLHNNDMNTWETSEWTYDILNNEENMDNPTFGLFTPAPSTLEAFPQNL